MEAVPADRGALEKDGLLDCRGTGARFGRGGLIAHPHLKEGSVASRSDFFRIASFERYAILLTVVKYFLGTFVECRTVQVR